MDHITQIKNLEKQWRERVHNYLHNNQQVNLGCWKVSACMLTNVIRVWLYGNYGLQDTAPMYKIILSIEPETEDESQFRLKKEMETLCDKILLENL